MQRSTRGRDAIRRPVARPVHPRDRTVSLSDREVKLMAHAPSAQSGASGQRPEARELLFKPDCPRAIDHHIDYFGGAGESPAETDDNGYGDGERDGLERAVVYEAATARWVRCCARAVIWCQRVVTIPRSCMSLSSGGD